MHLVKGSVAAALVLLAPASTPPFCRSALAPPRALVPRMQEQPQQPAPAAAAPPARDASKDWGGLPAAIQASQAGAINNQLVKAKDAESVLALTSKHAGKLSPVNVATALHRLAGHLKRNRAQRDGVLRDARFLALIDSTIELSDKLSPRSVSDVMWGCATLKHWPPTMLKPVLTQVAVHLQASAFEAQHLSLILWSFAVLECKPVRLLEMMEAAMLGPQLEAFNRQNCANVLWAFAKLRHRPKSLLPAMSARFLEPSFLDGLKPVEVADTAYALSELGTAEAEGPLLEALAARATADALLEQFSSRQLVTLLTAFSRLGSRPVQLESWLGEIEAAHARQPLLASDANNLEAALATFDIVAQWLRPAKHEAAEEGVYVEPKEREPQSRPTKG